MPVRTVQLGLLSIARAAHVCSPTPALPRRARAAVGGRVCDRLVETRRGVGRVPPRMDPQQHRQHGLTVSGGDACRVRLGPETSRDLVAFPEAVPRPSTVSTRSVSSSELCSSIPSRPQAAHSKQCGKGRSPWPRRRDDDHKPQRLAAVEPSERRDRSRRAASTGQPANVSPALQPPSAPRRRRRFGVWPAPPGCRGNRR